MHKSTESLGFQGAKQKVADRQKKLFIFVLFDKSNQKKQLWEWTGICVKMKPSIKIGIASFGSLRTQLYFEFSQIEQSEDVWCEMCLGKSSDESVYMDQSRFKTFGKQIV